MKVLIIRFSSIGDIILTSPVIRCLKLQRPETEIHYLTKQAYLSLLSSNPYIKRIIPFQNNLQAVVKELQAEKYDVVVDLHNNLRTSLIKLRLGGKKTSFKKLNIEKWLLVNLKIKRLPKLHIVDRYLKTVENLGVKNDGQGLDYFIPIQEEAFMSRLPEAHQSGYIAFAIGGKFATKRLPASKMISICKKIQKPIVLLGGASDADNARQIHDAVGDRIFNGCGIFSINQSALMVKRSDAVITHDTGMMHIAAAFNKQIISVWGNTVPEFGMYPYMPLTEEKSTIVEVAGLACRPCSKIGFAECPKGHFKCMNEIDELKIIAALK